MSRKAEAYRIREGDDVILRENEIHGDLDMRLDAVEQLGQAFAEGNRADVDALVHNIETTFSALGAQMQALLDATVEGVTADAVEETATRTFLTAARRVAILDDASAAAAVALAAGLAGKQAAAANLTGLSSGTHTPFGRALLGMLDEDALVLLLNLTKADVGLGNVTNTSDAAKPVSTAHQAALDLKVNVSDRAVGEVVYVLGSTPAPGTLKGNGALVSRAAYPDLAAYALASGMIVSDAAWLAGDTGKWSSGNGTTTIRLPDLRAEFLRGFDDGRGLDAGRGLGSVQAQNMPDHVHPTAVGFDANSIYGKLNGSYLPDSGSSGGTGILTFYASGATTSAGRFANTYGAVSAAGENRPRNVAPLGCIRF